MSFGLCNAPATFQKCMLDIFSDIVENYLEAFMDDLTVFVNFFDTCLDNLKSVLDRCKEKMTSFKLGKISFHDHF